MKTKKGNGTYIFLYLLAILLWIPFLHACKKTGEIGDAATSVVVFNGVTYHGLYVACDYSYPGIKTVSGSDKQTRFTGYDSIGDTIQVFIYGPIASGSITFDSSCLSPGCTIGFVDLFIHDSVFYYSCSSGNLTVNDTNTILTGTFTHYYEYNINPVEPPQGTIPPFLTAQLSGALSCH